MLKKSLLCLLLAMCVTTAAVAQDPMRFGAMLGLNMSGLAQDPEFPDGVDESMRLGLRVGPIVEFPLNQMIALQGGVLYSMKGEKIEYGNFEETLKLDYVSIPVMAKIGFMPEATARPFVKIGPELGILVSAKDEWEEPGDSGDDDIKDDLKSIDLGLGFGAGVEMPLSDFVGFLEASYTLGLMDIADSDDDDEDKQDDEEMEVKNRTISIAVGIKF